MNIIKTLTSSISEKGNYCYSLPVETTKEIIKDVKQLQQENQKLKADYGNKAQVERDLLLEENQKCKEVIDKAIEYINHFSKESEVKIYGLPKCKVFIGDIEQLLEILKEVE